MTTTPVQPHKIAGNPFTFIKAGRAVFTLVSERTGARYTFKAKKADPDPRYPASWYIFLLTGPDNEEDYTYLGIMGENGNLKLTKKSAYTTDSGPVRALAWTLYRLAIAGVCPGVEVWHASRCGRCGRTLTVPTSIETGFGPECSSKVGM